MLRRYVLLLSSTPLTNLHFFMILEEIIVDKFEKWKYSVLRKYQEIPPRYQDYIFVVSYRYKLFVSYFSSNKFSFNKFVWPQRLRWVLKWTHLPIMFKRSFQLHNELFWYWGKYMDGGNLEIVNVMFHQLNNYQTERYIVFRVGTECKISRK